MDNPDEQFDDQPAYARGPMCQVLFATVRGPSVTLDLVTLEPVTCATQTFAAGSPMSIAVHMRDPFEAALVGPVVLEWANELRPVEFNYLVDGGEMMISLAAEDQRLLLATTSAR